MFWQKPLLVWRDCCYTFGLLNLHLLAVWLKPSLLCIGESRSPAMLALVLYRVEEGSAILWPPFTGWAEYKPRTERANKKVTWQAVGPSDRDIFLMPFFMMPFCDQAYQCCSHLLFSDLAHQHKEPTTFLLPMQKFILWTNSKDFDYNVSLRDNGSYKNAIMLKNPYFPS